MPENDPLVSVGILCFNAEDTILDAIESALAQTYINKEVIVLDDFSSDNSFNKISKSTFIDKIKLFKNNKNFGIGYSRNKIFNLSQGDFICFMDDDDYSDPQRIQKQVIQIIKSGYPKKELIACCTGIKKVYKNGYEKVLYPLGSNGRSPYGNELADFLLYFDKKKGLIMDLHYLLVA